eukprot:m.134296 g.134296  ORF g.134296 m.134296 type:complete len:79 (-) comp13954_c0_seq17:148-384(-)
MPLFWDACTLPRRLVVWTLMFGQLQQQQQQLVHAFESMGRVLVLGQAWDESCRLSFKKAKVSKLVGLFVLLSFLFPFF